MPSTNKRLRFSFYIIARKSSGISGLSFQVDLQNQIEKNFTYKLQNSTAVDVIMLYIGKVDQKSAAAAVSDLFSYPDAAVPHHVLQNTWTPQTVLPYLLESILCYSGIVTISWLPCTFPIYYII